MKVRELRETITQLANLLQAAGVKQATVEGLKEFVESTVGFDDLTLKAFVKLADDGRRPKETAAPSTGGRSALGTDASAVVTEISDLYTRAGDPAVSEEQIRAACDQLPKLKKVVLLQIADRIELRGMGSKNLPVVAAAIAARLLERKGSAVRRQLIDRPAQVDTTTNPPQSTP